MSIRFVYMTAGNMEEAQRISRELVAAGMAACVNMLPQMKSIYVWEGKIEEASEVVMIAKTVEARLPDLIDKVKSLHSYSCPCVVSLKVEDGYAPFLEWVARQCGEDLNRAGVCGSGTRSCPDRLNSKAIVASTPCQLPGAPSKMILKNRGR